MKNIIAFLLFCCISLGIDGLLNGTTHAQSSCDDDLVRIAGLTSLLEKKKALQDLVSRCGSHAEINYQYAYCLERLRKYSEAVHYYKKATELDPRNPKYFFGLGDVYRILGRVNEARDAYEAGLSIAPGNRRVERCLHELELMTSERGDHVGNVGGAPSGQGEKAMVASPPPVAKPNVLLKISRPYIGGMDLPNRMGQLIRAKSLDKRIKDISTREFHKRKVLDEQYLVNGGGSSDGLH